MNKPGLIGRFSALVLVIALASIAYSIPNLTADRIAFPFVGMSMVYDGVDSGGNTEIRSICVLRYDAVKNHVTIRDSQDVFDVMEVDLGTRVVESHTGWGSFDPFYVEYWIPTNVGLGSHVKILNYDAVVSGYTNMCVDGRVVNVWQLQASGVRSEGLWQDTWYYDQRTGLLLSAAWVVWDVNGNVVYNWGGHLVSTNVVLTLTQQN